VLRHSRQDSRMGTRSSKVGLPPVLARCMFAIMNFAARKGFGAPQTSLWPSGDVAWSAKNRAPNRRPRRNLRLLRRRAGAVALIAAARAAHARRSRELGEAPQPSARGRAVSVRASHRKSHLPLRRPRHGNAPRQKPARLPAQGRVQRRPTPASNWQMTHAQRRGH
jgi:hypothetical protein